MRWSGSQVAFGGIVLMGLISGLIMLRVALSPGGWPGGNVRTPKPILSTGEAPCCLVTPRGELTPPPQPTEEPTAAVPDVSLMPSPIIIRQVITATIETAPVPSTGDAADDPAIWIHPTDPSQSTIIGTDKKGGLAVYDLAGKQIQYVPDGPLNNVDLRYNFLVGGRPVALVTATDREQERIAVYQVNPITRLLENVAARAIHLDISAYGLCMYHSPISGKYYVFVNSEQGEVEQWELFDDGNGKVDGKKVRAFDVGSPTEGCVADDEFARFYVGEQTVGIWRYGAEPEAGATRTSVDATGPAGHLTADVEGLTLYYASDGSGYLIASSQGSS
ncbi:MAG: 3-phytase, partial [Anaerolineales bacterium]|nr:3-phytase [Anaerolineales bacterium]